MLRDDARTMPSERERLDELRRYDILDTPPEASFDRLTALAARTFGVRIALISLLDDNRQWFKSCYGYDARETARELAFCRYTIQGGEVMVVPDAHADPRFKDNPLVTGEPYIRFYAGAPLLSSRGYALGTLCLIDGEPREFDAHAREMFEDFAALVVEALEFRLAAKRLKRAEDDTQLQSQERERLDRLVTQMVESANLAIIGVDAAGIIQSWNTAAEKLYGYAAAEVLGQDIAFLYPQDDKGAFKAQMARLARGKALRGLEVKALHKEGRPLELSVSISPIHDGEGGVIGASFIAADVGERNRMKRERERLFTLSHDLFCITDMRGYIKQANPAWNLVLGYTAEELLGKGVLELVHPEDQARVREAARRLSQGERISSFDTRLFARDGTYRWLSWSGASYPEEERVYAVARDISERKQGEERLRLLEKAVEHIGEAVLITDADLDYPGPRIVYVNEAFVRRTGYSREEVLGKTPRLLQGPKTDRSVLDRLHAALLREESFAARAVNYRKDGSTFLVEWQITPVRDARGKITHWASVQRDITERTAFEAKIVELNNSLRQRLLELDRKNEELETTAQLAEVRKHNLEQAAAELANTARQLHTIFALSPDGFASVDEQGNVAYVNDAFLRMTGLSPAQIVGLPERKLDRLIQDLCDPLMAYRSYLAGTETFEDALNLVRPRPMILKRTVRTLLSEDGELLGRVIYFRDITYEFEVDRMKSEFLSTTAHELRTPMTSIYGFSQLLLARDYDQATSKELIKTIHDQSARLVQLLNELLDLARIEARAGKDFKISAQPIAPIVEETLRGFANFSDKHELIVDLPGALPAVAVDADKMQQVLTNVLSNAYKYSPEGGAIRVSARVCERQQRRELGVIVQDEGIGMTPEQRARVFERFYRADSSGGIPGTGLGMSLVKEIVEIHGGSVEIDSALGKGTTVTVWLPLGEE